jgi:outer membrane translocation and assembly module TamA
LLYDHVMIRVLVTLVWVAMFVAWPALALAQVGQPDPQTPPPIPPKSKLPRDVKVDQGGGLHFTKHFAVVFGGIKQGSSIAVGPAVSWDFKDGGYLQIKGGFSVRQFKLLQARYDSRPLFNKRSVISTRLRWQDAPKLPLYQEGPDAPNQHLDIQMTKTEWSAFLRTLVAPRTFVSVGSGVEGYDSQGKWSDLIDAILRLGAAPVAPGLATSPWFVRSFVSTSYDTRWSPDYSRTGHALDAAVYHYHDGRGGTQSFQRFEMGAAQLLPTFKHESASGTPPTQYKGALNVFGRAWLSHTGEGQEMPVYLMTYLGGGDYLRGYPSYRFHDRNAVIVGTEYRYAIHKMLDLAILLEAGTVAPKPSAFSLDEMAGSTAIGVRVHTKTSGLVRLDLAHGRDGFKVAVGMALGS